MTCPRCQALQAELAQAREELAAWRAHSDDTVQDDQALARLARWQAALGLTLSQAMILIALVDRKGAPMSRPALNAVLSRRPGADHDRDVEDSVVQAFVCRLRQQLAHEGLGQPIQTVWGLGYAIAVESAAALKARVGEA